MPTRPPIACSTPGCAAIATDGGRCPAHKRAPWATTKLSAHKRGYGARWRRIRSAKLARNPVCEICDKALATEVDHVKAKAHGGTDDDANLQSVCTGCHRAKTAKGA